MLQVKLSGKKILFQRILFWAKHKVKPSKGIMLYPPFISKLKPSIEEINKKLVKYPFSAEHLPLLNFITNEKTFETKLSFLWNIVENLTRKYWEMVLNQKDCLFKKSHFKKIRKELNLQFEKNFKLHPEYFERDYFKPDEIRKEYEKKFLQNKPSIMPLFRICCDQIGLDLSQKIEIKPGIKTKIDLHSLFVALYNSRNKFFHEGQTIDELIAKFLKKIKMKSIRGTQEFSNLIKLRIEYYVLLFFFKMIRLIPYIFQPWDDETRWLKLKLLAR